MNHQELVEEAFKAMKNAYAPYSNYHVGAAVLTADGTVFWGANVENASYGATNCAERSAVFAAYSRGYRKETIQALAIVSDGDKLAGPCGICRQVLSEFVDDDFLVIMYDEEQGVKAYPFREILPFRFDLNEY